MAIYEATVTIYVRAEGKIYARLAADRADSDLFAWEVSEVDSIDEVDPAWRDLIPWCEDDEDDERTVRQLLRDDGRGVERTT